MAPSILYVTCAADGPAAGARRLELDLGEQRELMNAKLADGDKQIPLVIHSVGPRSWRIARGAQS